ncbi:lipid A 4'kinase [Thiomonas arsenitoxydans]|uniref:Tetraacyldisaccharide 4'-kinase n=1 Tax=Thiomonas arsenitoxydans (strain DSM 22701 / CIP 110005 / 3As) TaxID=426114 RepID=D6CTY3_THIA3|nr:tetraacyldisaccharide 4'-kinase [Thiomonas arsenitoxydans]CQR44277.1 lipid A 4'kinase [Thiomonas sp. CB3]CAZ88752.1 putative Tetraacyldisaccharide 4'-kinase (Lipid A 4'-kinase) LpxK [Thiomonas arsenitoxydans]CQR26373.1 lipid A 4'kinase [Thiomonas arsenitoxydans]CQR28181.1 lipid A 4'kinase [Thiomonas arsenitoxydans]CQR35099.1 lipid A 4'kinase [Thiomonas arsenitoxydans]
MAQPAGHSGWPDWWLRRSLLSWALWPLSRLFALLSAGRRSLYRAGVLRAERVGVPVVVVGNLTVGGAGKTPLITELARGLQQVGWRPGIVSRGYGRRSADDTPLRVDAQSDPAECGDEPVLLARLTGCPVMVGRRRAQAAFALRAAWPDVDVILSDDGLQHLALARDVELVVVDQRLWGNGWLLPAGPLRESPGRRRDATLGPEAALQQVSGGGRHFALVRSLGDITHIVSAQTLSAAQFVQRFGAKPLGAVAGIGHPRQFFAMLQALGLTVQTRALGDHQPLSTDALAGLPPDGPILLTEKDAIKSAHLPPVLRERLWVVGLRLQLPADLLPWLHQQLEKARGLPTS